MMNDADKLDTGLLHFVTILHAATRQNVATVLRDAAMLYKVDASR